MLERLLGRQATTLGRVLKIENMNVISLIAPSRSGHNFTAEMIRSWFDPDTQVHQFEAIPPQDFQIQFEQRTKHRVNHDRDRFQFVLQVRDYLNFAASWTKYNLKQGRAYRMEKVVKMFDIWNDIARESLKETNYIPGKVVLYYDQFVKSEAYRKSLCLVIDGHYTERKLNYIPNGGMGSSFDKFSLQGRGSDMNVTERWKWFLTEEGSEYIPYLKVKKNILEY